MMHLHFAVNKPNAEYMFVENIAEDLARARLTVIIVYYFIMFIFDDF